MTRTIFRIVSGRRLVLAAAGVAAVSATAAGVTGLDRNGALVCAAPGGGGGGGGGGSDELRVDPVQQVGSDHAMTSQAARATQATSSSQRRQNGKQKTR
jgi:hypothetical protein